MEHESIALQGEMSKVEAATKAKKASRRKYCAIGFALGVLLAAAVCVVLFFLLKPAATSESPEESTGTATRKGEGSFEAAAVASDAGPCSEIGAKKLKEGGSVVDAAIATMVCGGVVNPQSAGIGGGSFMAIYIASTNETVFIDSRETAPIKSHRDMYDGNGFISLIGSLSIAVPGEVAGYWHAHQRYGKLPWKSLFEDSIELARKGITVHAALETDIRKEEKYVRNSTFNLKPIFVNPDGSLKKQGDTIVMETLAQTLRAIADDGYEGFYHGILAKRIIADIDDAVEESIITLDDLKNYTLDVKPLLNVTIGDLTLFTPGTPSSGAVLGVIFNILRGYGFTPDDLKTKEASILTYHRIVEAFKHAFAHRSKLGDERSNRNITKLVERMLSPEYGDELKRKISDDVTYNSTQYGGDFAFDSGTSHISVVGSDGSAVSATSTINTRFGSKIRGIRTGIIFNNEMDDFSAPAVTNYFDLPPSEANFIAPRKRPMSSMVPSIVLQKGSKRPVFVTGGSGGTKIITGTALVIMQSIWFGKGLEDATNEKRIHHQLYPEYIQYEEGFDMDIIEGLKKKGHVAQSFSSRGSIIQSIKSTRDEGYLTAVCDARKGGYPDGY